MPLVWRETLFGQAKAFERARASWCGERCCLVEQKPLCAASRGSWCRRLAQIAAWAPVGSMGDFGCGWRIGPISPISPISQEPLGAASRGAWCRCLAQITALVPVGSTGDLGCDWRRVGLVGLVGHVGHVGLVGQNGPWCGERRCLVSAFGADSGVGSLSVARVPLAATGE